MECFIMSVFKVCIVLSTVWWSVVAVNEEELKEAAKNYYMQRLYWTSEDLPDISDKRFSIRSGKFQGLELKQGHITGIDDKSIENLEIYKKTGYYSVVFTVKINNLGCSYDTYQEKPKGGSACSGSWAMENINNHAYVMLALQHHRWTPDHSECRVDIQFYVQSGIDSVNLDMGSSCQCCDTYDKSVKQSLEKKLKEAVEHHLYDHYNRGNNWATNNIINMDCKVEPGV